MLVKKTILSNDNLIKVLEYYGYCQINDKGKEIRCCRKEGWNPTGISILKDENITSSDYVDNISGDIFTLIMAHQCKSFKEVVNEIRDLLNIKVKYRKKEQNESVSNIYSDLVFKRKDEIPVYDEEILDDFEDRWNLRFLRDGISIDTQKKFDIRYDPKSERIVIPHRDQYGDLCGIMGRTNLDEVDNYKYFPLISYKKSRVLYGYSINYDHLYKADTIYIGEAEKFVLQLDTMGYHNALALSGNALSREQIIMIARLQPKRIIFCFDEGLDKMVIYRNANKFKIFTDRTGIEVGVLIDNENKYLKKGSKNSPSDLGKEVWEKILDECYEEI